MDYINLRTEAFKQTLYKLAEEAQLPVANLYYVINNFSNELASLYQQSIAQEQEQYNKEQEQKQQESKESDETVKSS